MRLLYSCPAGRCIMKARSQGTLPMTVTRLTGLVLVASFLVLIPAALLYFTRDMGAAALLDRPRLVLERGLIILTVVLTAIGLFLLSYALRASQGAALLVVGALVYLFGGVLIVAAEVIGVTNADYTDVVFIGVSIYRLQMAYVLLAFLGQAAIGFGLAQSPDISASIGWLTVIWNLGLFALALMSRNWYFPWMHHMMPLVIGASLLLRPKYRKG